MTYNSFWIGGFEGADHINGNQDKLDMVKQSGHEENITHDYKLLSQIGIKTVRESIGWRTSQPTKDSALCLDRTIKFAESAKENNIQVIWTFMHYGTPDGISILDDSFILEFAKYCKLVAEVLAKYSDEPVYNLINEISFLAWATSHTNFMYPYIGNGDSHQGYQVKKRLVKAVLLGIEEIKKISPKARFLHVEPIMHFATPPDRQDLQGVADNYNQYQWQTFDLIKGAMEPEIGGHLEALDLIGVNYYYNCQIEVGTDIPLDWKEKDSRRVSFESLLKLAFEKYQRPIIISETGHFGDDRERWLKEIINEVDSALNHGLPIQGICLYPIVDRPCWHEPHKIIKTGLIQIKDDGRSYHLGSAKTILRCIQRSKLGNDE